MWSVRGRYVIGKWSVCDRYVVGTWSVCGRYVIGTWSVSGRYVIVMWIIQPDDSFSPEPIFPCFQWIVVPHCPASPRVSVAIGEGALWSCAVQFVHKRATTPHLEYQVAVPNRCQMLSRPSAPLLRDVAADRAVEWDLCDDRVHVKRRAFQIGIKVSDDMSCADIFPTWNPAALDQWREQASELYNIFPNILVPLGVQSWFWFMPRLKSALFPNTYGLERKPCICPFTPTSPMLPHNRYLSYLPRLKTLYTIIFSPKWISSKYLPSTAWKNRTYRLSLKVVAFPYFWYFAFCTSCMGRYSPHSLLSQSPNSAVWT